MPIPSDTTSAPAGDISASAPVTSSAPAQKRYCPFPSGFAFGEWYDHNCDRCTKGVKPGHIGINPACPIEDTLVLASLLDGSFLLLGEHTPEQAAALAARLHWDGSGYLSTVRCPEFTAKSIRE